MAPPALQACQQCGTAINTVKRRGRPSRFCSDKCRRADYLASLRKGVPADEGEGCTADGCTRRALGRGLCPSHYSAWHRDQKRYSITCEWCGVEVSVPRKTSQFCGRDCREAANRARPVPPERTQRILATKAAARISRQQLLPHDNPSACGPVAPETPTTVVRGSWFCAGFCRVCSTAFVSRHFVSTCSEECAVIKKREDVARGKAKRRAVKVAAYVEDVRRSVVFLRDKYTCHLCQKKIKMDAVAPHPLAPTLDHVVPLAAGGTHEYANVRAAHFLCNCMKGAGGGGEQLMLIG